MGTELFITIYSSSLIHGNDQIECNFRCLEEHASGIIESELSKIFERNKEIDNISYKVTAKTKIYIRRNKPFSCILSPKMRIFNCPKNWMSHKNVTLN